MVDITATIEEPEEINVTLDGGGITDFTDLVDTPSSYSGQSGKVVSVKSTEDELEFTSVSGDVVGPSSATDDSIATFDTTTGKLIKDSGLIISDGKIYQSGYATSYIKFNNGTIEIWAGGVKQVAWS